MADRMDLVSVRIKVLSRKFRAWEEQYRRKIYPKLSDEEKIKRNYRVIGGKEYCDLMKKARAKYFKEEINAIIKELVDIQRSGFE